MGCFCTGVWETKAGTVVDHVDFDHIAVAGCQHRIPTRTEPTLDFHRAVHLIWSLLRVHSERSLDSDGGNISPEVSRALHPPYCTRYIKVRLWLENRLKRLLSIKVEPSLELFMFYRTKSIATGITAAILYITISIYTKIFYVIEPWLTVQGTFVLYGLIGISGFMYLWVYMPETEGKTMAEIAELFADDARQTCPHYRKKK